MDFPTEQCINLQIQANKQLVFEEQNYSYGLASVVSRFESDGKPLGNTFTASFFKWQTVKLRHRA